jgi:choline dehydrogenase-like flavoprotein
MSLDKLIPSQTPASFDVQDTTFSHDILGRDICNTWKEIDDAQKNGGYPFDAIVIGAGMFGGYCAEKLYRLGSTLGLRILVIEAGAFLLPSHIQNLPQRLGGKIGGVDYLRTRDDANGTQNVIWGMPWISNEGFPGLAYCVGGRSLFWGGWAPKLTTADLGKWPTDIRNYLNGTTGYKATETEIGVDPSTDYIVKATLYSALKTAFETAKANVTSITEITEAPLAVQGNSPGSGLFSFDKFSSAPFLMDAIRDDVSVNNSHGDVSRRIFLLPRTQVLRLNRTGNAIASLDLVVNGQPQTLTVSPTCAVILANGTIEATRLALDSLGIGSIQFGAPRVGNLMAHLRSNITVRIKRSALGLSALPSDLETTALLVRGTEAGRQFHLQVTAAAVIGSNPEKNMWSMVPDIDLLQNLLANQASEWIVITLRGIGEMESQFSSNPDTTATNPKSSMSWIDLSNEIDRGVRRAYVNLVATQPDKDLWTAMDNAAFKLALEIAQVPANIQYWNDATKTWQDQQPQADASGKKFWQDVLGTTHHEAGTLFMGDPGKSITDLNGKFHNVSNGYVVSPAVFPTLGSANPSLTALSLARRTAEAIVQIASSTLDSGFTPLSLDSKDWQMVQQPGMNPRMKHYGKVLETLDGYGLYWYIKEQFTNFILKLEWRVGRRDDNSGIFIRIPVPSVPNALGEAVAKGHEIQIDDRGYDSNNQTEGNPLKLTGAIYDLIAPSAFASNPIGTWNTYIIEANAAQIKVTLNGQQIVDYTSNRQTSGYIALQAYKYTSRVQFRNLQIRKLP